LTIANLISNPILQFFSENLQIHVHFLQILANQEQKHQSVLPTIVK